MNSDANTAEHLSIELIVVNGEQNLTGFVEFFFTNIWWIAVDMQVISVVERYFRLGLKYLILLKVNLLYINYVLIICIAYSSSYIHKFSLNIYE